MKKFKRITILFTVIFFLLSLSACKKSMSNNELKENFFYIEDQYANVLYHYDNDNYDEDNGSGEFPDHANSAIKKINNKIDLLKKSNSTESNMIAKYGIAEKKSIKILIKKHFLEKDISLKDKNSELSNEISKKHFHNKHSKKMTDINSTYFAVTHWKGITFNEKGDFTVNDDTGYVEISGKAQSNQLLKVYGSKIGNHSTRVSSDGTFKLKIFYPKDSDTDIIVNYDRKGVDMPIHGNIHYSNIYSEKYLAAHPKKNITPNEDTTNNNINQPSENSTSDDKNSGYTSKPKATSQDKAALRKAVDYSDTMHLSKQGIYEQLTSEAEGFPAEAAQYAIDNMTGDWNHNVLMKAKDYRSTMNMSDADIYDQLTSQAGEGFTPDQANYAIQNLDK